MPKPRVQTKRKPKPRILILCEGEKTEPLYFKALKGDPAYKNLSSIDIIVSDTKPNTAKELVNLAIKLKKEASKQDNPLFEIWVIIDKDGYTKHAEAFDLALKNTINIAFSSICFEYWILLHFLYTTKQFANCDEVINFLSKNGVPNYKKNLNIYDLIKTKKCSAIAHAKKLRGALPDLHTGTLPYKLNPYTNIDALVCRLIHFGELRDRHNNYIKIPHNLWDINLSDLIDSSS
ncbi:MAG: RloB family protein [Desulfovibrio sp.]